MSPDGSTIVFRAIPSHLRLTTDDKRSLKSFLHELTQTVAGGRGFCCLLTGDSELQRLNREFLQHDYPTDVLSFPAGDGGGWLGELAISMERASAQAQQFGHATLDELRILMLHGVLHLTGLDHERDRGEMSRAERKFRSQFNLPNTLIARASQ
jgi:probable rRNA maturation factor